MAAETLRVGKRGTVVIPAGLRRRLGLEEGSILVVEGLENGLLLRPAVAVISGERLRGRQLLEEANRELDALELDPDAWAAELKERRALEGTLMDGLDPNEVWTRDGRVTRRRPRS